MTLTATTVRVSYDGDDSTIAFPITFVFWGNDDLDVVLRDSAGVETAWTRGTQYTLTGGSGATGTLTAETAPTDYTPATGETLVIASALANTQPTEIPLGGALPSAPLEQQLDQTVRQGQQRDEKLGRALTFPITDDASLSAELPASSARASKAFHFDSGGEPLMVEPTDASGTSVTATGSTSSRLLAERFAEIVNVKDYGALGDGVTDDTVAIDAAWAVVQDQGNNYFATIGRVFMVVNGPKLYFPPGDYVYDGDGLGSINPFVIEGDGEETTRIQIGAGKYFINTSNNLMCAVRNLHFNGGAGVFRLTESVLQIQGQYIFERLICSEYTVCAIASLSQDRPHIKVRDCFFDGTDTSIGVAIKSGSAATQIERNQFHRNLYHIKATLDNAQIHDNDFFRFDASAVVRHDVWLVLASGNKVQGVNILNNKFGNENLGVNDHRILLAEEDTTVNDFADTPHDPAASTEIIEGLRIKDNSFLGNSGWLGNYVFSTSYQIRQMVFDNFHYGTLPTKFFGFAGSIPATNVDNQDNYVSYRSINEGPNLLQPPVADSNLGHYDDPHGFLQGRSDFAQFHKGGGPDVSLLVGFDGDTHTAAVVASATKTPITDALEDASQASEVDFSSDSGTYHVVTASLTAERVTWAEVDLKQSGTNPISTVEILLTNSTGGQIMRRVVSVPASWTSFRYFAVPKATEAHRLRITPFSSAYSAGVSDRVDVGRIKVYQAHEPQTLGRTRHHTMVLQDGVTAPATVTGKATIYIDTADGDLKIKFGDGFVATIAADS